MIAIRIFFTTLGVALILLGFYMGSEINEFSVWPFFIIAFGIWFIYDVNKK